MSVFLGRILSHAGWKALHNLGGKPHTHKCQQGGDGGGKSALPLTGLDEGLFQADLLNCPRTERAS